MCKQGPHCPDVDSPMPRAANRRSLRLERMSVTPTSHPAEDDGNGWWLFWLRLNSCSQEVDFKQVKINDSMLEDLGQGSWLEGQVLRCLTGLCAWQYLGSRRHDRADEGWAILSQSHQVGDGKLIRWRGLREASLCLAPAGLFFTLAFMWISEDTTDVVS